MYVCKSGASKQPNVCSACRYQQVPKQPDILQPLLTRVQRQFDQLLPQHIHQLMVAVTELKLQPSSDWTMQLLEASRRIICCGSCQDVVLLLRGVTVWGQVVNQQWVDDLYTAVDTSVHQWQSSIAAQEQMDNNVSDSSMLKLSRFNPVGVAGGAFTPAADGSTSMDDILSSNETDELIDAHHTNDQPRLQADVVNVQDMALPETTSSTVMQQEQGSNHQTGRDSHTNGAGPCLQQSAASARHDSTEALLDQHTIVDTEQAASHTNSKAFICSFVMDVLQCLGQLGVKVPGDTCAGWLAACCRYCAVLRQGQQHCGPLTSLCVSRRIHLLDATLFVQCTFLIHHGFDIHVSTLHVPYRRCWDRHKCLNMTHRTTLMSATCRARIDISSIPALLVLLSKVLEDPKAWSRQHKELLSQLMRPVQEALPQANSLQLTQVGGCSRGWCAVKHNRFKH